MRNNRKKRVSVVANMRNDKLKHFLACGLIALITLAVFAIVPHGNMYGWDKGIAVIIGSFVALFKEIIWDKWLHKGTPDFYDFFWGVMGAFAFTFLWIIIETII